MPRHCCDEHSPVTMGPIEGAAPGGYPGRARPKITYAPTLRATKAWWRTNNQCPVMAQSRHRFRRWTCPLSGGKADIPNSLANVR